jgi:hypothetical protein
VGGRARVGTYDAFCVLATGEAGLVMPGGVVVEAFRRCSMVDRALQVLLSWMFMGWMD